MKSAVQDFLRSVRGGLAKARDRVSESILSITLFRQAVRLTVVLAVVASVYWLMIASDRYVSEANVIIQKTELVSGPVVDITSLIGVGGAGGAIRPDQLLLREYLLSVDMLKSLDATLDLRSHYSDWRRDPIARMWFKDASMEWFHRYYLSRVSVEFDDYAGVLRIKVQAYEPEVANAIASMLAQEGERYMNQIGHELAETQVKFLTTQVTLAQERFRQASQALLNFQNKKGLASPQATAESIIAIIAKLEAQRTDLQTQLASLPASLERNHPNILMLKRAIEAVERQILQERARLASMSGKTLNYTVEEFERLKMNVSFTQDIYRTALIGLEKGQIDATRTLKKVSLLQAPTFPEYPMEPRRIYNTVVTLLLATMIAGILKLLESVVRDHVD